MLEKLYLFCCKNVTPHFGPITQGKYCDILVRLKLFMSEMMDSKNIPTHVDPFPMQASEDRIGPSRKCAVLAFQNDSDLIVEFK